MAVQPVDDGQAPTPQTPKPPTAPATDPAKPPMTPPASPTPTPIPVNPPALTAANPTPPMPAPTQTPASTPALSNPVGQIGDNRPVYNDFASSMQNTNGFYIPGATAGTQSGGMTISPYTGGGNGSQLPGATQGTPVGATDTQGRPLDRALWGKDTSITSPQTGGPGYQGPALDGHGGLLVPNTQSDGAGGFRSDVPRDGVTGLPITGLPSWGDTANITQPGAPAGSSAPTVPYTGAPGGNTPLPPNGMPRPSGVPSLSAAAGSPNAPGIGPAQGGVSSGASGGIPGVSTAAIAPDSATDLRNQMVLPDAGVDRFKLAQDRFDTMSKASDPAYQASLRAATQRGAANGTLGSGMLNTDYGNLAEQRGRDLDTSRNTLLQNELEGTIDDGRSNRAEVRGERGYENGLENQAYTRGVQGLTLEDALTNSAFGRAQGQSAAGNINNPTALRMQQAAMYGDRASSAGSAAAGLQQGRATNKALQGLSGAAYGRPGQTPAPSAPPTTTPPVGTPKPDGVSQAVWDSITGGY